MQLCGARILLLPAYISENELKKHPPAEETSLPVISPKDIAFIQYTSGSTSDPKGVQLSHANLLTNIRQMIAGMEITAKDTFVSWLPVYHDMGLILMTLVPFFLGLKLVLLPATLHQVHQWLQAIRDHRGTFTAAPDTAYRLAAKWAKAGHPYDLSSLRVALNAAEPVRLSTIQGFEETFGLRGVMTAGYGLAEASVGVCMSRPGQRPPVDEAGRVSVGRPFPEIAIAILNEGKAAEAGEPGEIFVKSPANTAGYFNNPAANADLFQQKGHIRTGDIGYKDSEGNLFFLGRTKQAINAGGRTIYAADIEESMEEISGVKFAAALGIRRGKDGDEQLTVFAETRWRQLPSPEAGKDLIIAIVRQIHDRFGIRPAKVYLLPPKSIPFTFNGKKQHNLLEQWHASGALKVL
jgi:acyl-CoA synthetase (AMP-forming)/AMP-acid ligase II